MPNKKDKKKSVPANTSAEEKLEEGLTLILSALPRLIVRWIKKKK